MSLNPASRLVKFKAPGLTFAKKLEAAFHIPEPDKERSIFVSP
jgi:hypothetical protein